MKALLEIRNLTVGLEKQLPVLNGLSMSIGPGEIVGLAGDSGSGKSMLARTIPRLEPKYITSDNATIRFDSKIQGQIDLLKQDEKTLPLIRGKEISMIFQEPKVALNPVYSCGFQVMEMVMKHLSLDKDTSTEKVKSLFDQVGLQNRIFDAYPHQISGGEAQRVMISMASVSAPQLLIADEPTTSLDPKNEQSIIDWLQELNQDLGMSILLVSHDFNLIKRVSHRSLFLDNGIVSDDYRKTLSNIFISGEKPISAGNLKKVLEVQNLSYSVNASQSVIGKASNVILSSLNFEVFEGETLGIIGDSGSGKTSLARCLLKLVKPDSGQIKLLDNDLDNISSGQLKKLRRNIQIVFQDPLDSLNPRMTVKSVLTEPLRTHKICSNRSEQMVAVKNMLEKVGLYESKLNRYPHQLSGGERQRICIARVLLLSPRLLILDEPVTSLDYSKRSEILQLLIQLKSEFNLTYIFISHDIDLIRSITNRVLVMKDGTILEQGKTSEIFEKPSHDYTTSLLRRKQGK